MNKERTIGNLLLLALMVLSFLFFHFMLDGSGARDFEAGISLLVFLLFYFLGKSICYSYANAENGLTVICPIQATGCAGSSSFQVQTRCPYTDPWFLCVHNLASANQNASGLRGYDRKAAGVRAWGTVIKRCLHGAPLSPRAGFATG